MSERRFGRLLRKFSELPQDAFAGCTSINIITGNTAYVYGCDKIIKYGNDEIILQLNRLTVRITGRVLSMKSFYGSDIEIGGDICSVELKER